MFKRFSLILILLLVSLGSADLTIENWQQRTALSPTSIEQEINWTLSADTEPNSYYNSWSYIFDPLQQIEIKELYVNGSLGKYQFAENRLQIELPKVRNKEKVQITLKYRELENNDLYFCQQYITIPTWAAGATSKLSVTIPNNTSLCGGPQKFTRNKNTFSWAGVVPAEGISELFQYTARQTRWQIQKNIQISGSGTTQGFEIYLPFYFTTGQNKVLKNEIQTSLPELSKTASQNYQVFKFRSLNKITITLTAEINTGEEFYKFELPIRPEYLALSPKTAEIAGQLAKNILAKKDDRPVHVKLAQWVHEYITYDYGYQGRKMTVQQIFATRKGVCEHYSQLYIALCRAAGIPALELSGYAYTKGLTSGPQGWGAHSWVLVYVNGKWTQLDPTWNLTTGIVPVSHIALYINEFNPYSYMLRDYYGRLFVDENEIEIKELP